MPEFVSAVVLLSILLSPSFLQAANKKENKTSVIKIKENFFITTSLLSRVDSVPFRINSGKIPFEAGIPLVLFACCVVIKYRVWIRSGYALVNIAPSDIFTESPIRIMVAGYRVKLHARPDNAGLSGLMAFFALLG
jgi:hypothetical protein